ncbi:MAG: NUDIX pyrophosphatase [Candidatus Heimdallarchaeota archaeon]|nr:NUDIX pyrophosphatase [Candidatus Heimdallarchaeota archaeon]
MAYRTPIQVLVYPVRHVETGMQYLLLKRTEERGGFWQGVTGHTEKGEKIIECAKRELLEETSFIPKFIFQTEYTYTIDIAKEHKNEYPPNTKEFVEHVFVARIDQKDEPAIDPNEHTEYTWCSYEEAIKLLKWDNNKKALEYCHSLLKEE